MLGIERAEKSRKHKASVEATASSVIKYIEELLSKYNDLWNQLEKNRKQRAALIEEIIKTLKDNSVKTNVPLGKCDNRQLNIELESVFDKLELAPKELIQCNLIKANNRYEEIIKIGKQLDAISLELSKIRVPEKDYKEEVILDLSKIDDIVKEESKVDPVDIVEDIRDDSFDEVIAISNASDTLNESLDRELNMGIDDSFDEDTIELNDLVEKSLEDLLNEYESVDSKEDDEFVSYEIKDGESFLDINEKVYEGQVPWNALYAYGNNEEAINRYADLYNMSIYDCIKDKHVLAGTIIEIPLQMTYNTEEDIDITIENNDDSYQKVA